VVVREAAKQPFRLLSYGLGLDAHLVEVDRVGDLLPPLVLLRRDHILAQTPNHQVKLLEVLFAVQPILLALDSLLFEEYVAQEHFFVLVVLDAHQQHSEIGLAHPSVFKVFVLAA